MSDYLFKLILCKNIMLYSTTRILYITQKVLKNTFTQEQENSFSYFAFYAS